MAATYAIVKRSAPATSAAADATAAAVAAAAVASVAAVAAVAVVAAAAAVTDGVTAAANVEGTSCPGELFPAALVLVAQLAVRFLNKMIRP